MKRYNRGILSILTVVVCFVSGVRADYMAGIDVSHYQGTINWNSVAAAGKEFAFVKATQGVDYVDSMFLTNVTGAHAAGLLTGTYHYATPYTGGAMDAAQEAADYAAAISPYLTDGYLRPVLDIESGYALGKSVLSNWINVFQSTMVTLTGYEPIIYCNSNYASNYFDISIANYDLWIARWSTTEPTSSTCGVWDDWSFWQYSDSGSVSGISGAVDLNYFKGDIGAFMVPEPLTLTLLAAGAFVIRKKRRR